MKTSKIIKLGTILLCLSLLISCNSTKSIEAHSKTTEAFSADSARDVTKALLQGLSLDNMIKLDKKDISSHYGFDAELVDDFSAYASSAEGCADEIAAFKVTDDDDNQKVLTAVREKIELKKQSYKELNAAEYKKFKSTAVSTYGDYIVITVCDSSKKAAEILNDFYK